MAAAPTPTNNASIEGPDRISAMIEQEDGHVLVQKSVHDPDKMPTYGTMAMAVHIRKTFPQTGRKAPIMAFIMVPAGYDNSPLVRCTEKKLVKKGIYIVGIPDTPFPAVSTAAMER